MSEIIVDGTTGSLVSDVASAAAAVMRVDQLDRQTVREVAVQRFNHDRMVDDYVEVYRHAVAKHRQLGTEGPMLPGLDAGAVRPSGQAPARRR